MLEKILDSKSKALIKTTTEERIKYWSDYLWTYQSDSCIPHGTTLDKKHQNLQPILISNSEQNINNAGNLLLLDETNIIQDANFKKCLILFEGNNKNQLDWGKSLYESVQDEKKYYIQTQSGWNLENK